MGTLASNRAPSLVTVSSIKRWVYKQCVFIKVQEFRHRIEQTLNKGRISYSYTEEQTSCRNIFILNMSFVSLYTDSMRIPIIFKKKHRNLFKRKEKFNLNHRVRCIPSSLWSNHGQDHTKPTNHCLWNDIGILTREVSLIRVPQEEVMNGYSFSSVGLWFLVRTGYSRKNSSRWVDRARIRKRYLVIIQRIPKYDRYHCQNRPSISSLTSEN
jgi:hypothetical protein